MLASSADESVDAGRLCRDLQGAETQTLASQGGEGEFSLVGALQASIFSFCCLQRQRRQGVRVHGNMIIGLSGGDIYLGIKLLHDCLQALSNSKGSQKQYLDAVHQLETLEICLKVAQCKLSGLEVEDSRNIVARAITECAKCIDSYQKEIISKYERFFGAEVESNTRRKFVRELKKIQWLQEKDKTEALSKAIASHVQIITLACSIGSLSSDSRCEDSARRQTKVSVDLSDILQASACGPASASSNSGLDVDNTPQPSIIACGSGWKGKDRELNSDQPSLYSSISESLLPLGAETTSPKQASTSSSPSSGQYHLTSTSPTKHSHPPDEQVLYHSESPLPLSRATTATILSSTVPSVFSRRLSNRTSLTSIAPTVSTTTTLSTQWVDDRGVCHNPSCQKRTFVQKKVFALYTHLTHNSVTPRKSGGLAEAHGAKRPMPTCEHSLLYHQALAEATLKTGELQI